MTETLTVRIDLTILIGHSPFTASALEQHSTGLAAECAGSAVTSQKLSEVLMKDFEEWPVFDFRLLFYREGRHDLPQPMNKRIKCRAQSFYKNKGRVPVLAKDGFVYQLDEENLKKDTPPLQDDFSAELRSSMLSGTAIEPGLVAKLDQVVDLHIEKLNVDIKGLSNDAICLKNNLMF